MKTKQLQSILFFIFFSSILIIIGCKKEDEEENKVETVKETITNTVIDTFYIDYTTKMVYTVTVLSGNHVSIGPGKSGSVVAGAVVTAVQGDVRLSQTTDETGVVTFTGLYKGAISVGISKDDYTGANYIVTINNFVKRDSTNKGQATQIYVSNQVPIFKIRNDQSVARITGRVSYQNDLTNINRETVPEGTVVAAYIDASDPAFFNTYLKVPNPTSDSVFGGKILQIAYESNFMDSTDAQGNYEIIIPAAVIGLPFKMNAADVLVQQKVFENTGVAGFNRTKEYRTLFSPMQFPSPVPSAGGAEVMFISGGGALASATVSGTGQLDKINITNGGTGYTSAPKITITGGGGSGATATASVTNGVITAINIVNPGSGYTSDPLVTIAGGTGAVVSATIGGGGTIVALQVVNSGAGYTTAPTVTLSAPALPDGVNATANAIIQNGHVTGFTITNAGSGYTSSPGVTIDVAPAGGTNATAVAQFSGFSVQNTTIVNPGFSYTGNPTVSFSNPDLPTGVKAQGIATVNTGTGQVTGFSITNAGSGYINPPIVTLSSGSGGAAQALFSGRIVSGITVLAGGADYTSAPKVRITGGGGIGAAGTATVLNGKVTGITITNAGSGYTGAPTVELIAGEGAQASVVVSNGQITAINLVNGGYDYTGAPKLLIIPFGGPGSGATATATVDVASGAVTGINITNPGTGYLGGNTPSIAEPFSIVPELTVDKLMAKPGGTYIRDIHYGTGLRMPD
jgi:uncharacterized protein YuzE